MGMPNDLVLVRHGESEGNVAVDAAKAGDTSLHTEQYMTTPGRMWRLTARGRAQAQLTGSWMRSNGLARFDRYLVSPYVRPRETAAHLALPDAAWMLNRALRERDWGDIGSMPLSEFNTLPEFRHSAAVKRTDPLYWRPPGGESIAGVAEDRIRNVLSTMHRECDGQKVVAVCHGEVMWAFRLVLERLDDETFVQLDSSPAEKIRNCMVLHYTRIDPATGLQATRLKWVRRAWPQIDSSTSAEWVMHTEPWREFDPQLLSNDQLLAGAEQVPALFEAHQSQILPAATTTS